MNTPTYKNLDKATKAYSEILDVVKKHGDTCVFDIDKMDRESKCHLFGIELKEKYGLNISDKSINDLNWVRCGEYKVIGSFGKKHNRTISWSDDGRQPDDEMLVYISFPTGAYIFGQDYPTELFQTFFQELKSYKPKYCDTTNKSLYYSLDTAKEVFNNFEDILRKYNEINKEDFKKRRIDKMRAELEQLEKQ